MPPTATAVAPGWPVTPATLGMAPAHGEDTEKILIDTLDYTWDDIARLQDEGVIL